MANSKSTFKDIVKKAAEAAANAARNTTQMQRGQQPQTPAAQTVQPQRNSTFAALVETAAKAREAVLNNPSVMSRTQPAPAVAPVQTKTFADFNSAQELYDYRLKNTAKNADGNAVSMALQADLDAIDRRNKELQKNAWYHTADEMEQINAQYSPEDAVYSKEQIAAAREMESLPAYRDQLEVAYYQQQEKERLAALNKALSPYKALYQNADFEQVVSKAASKEQPKYEPEKSLGSTLLDVKLGGAGTRIAAENFQNEVDNPALWAAANSADLLAADAKYSAAGKGLTDSRAGYLYMNDDEIQMYTYLLEAQGKKAAEEYYGIISDELSLRRQNSRYMSQAEWAKEHPWAASFASFGTSLMQPVGYVGNAVDYLVNGETDINSIWNAPAQLTSAFREGSTSNLYNDYNAYAQELANKEMRGEEVTQEELSKLEELEAAANVLSFLSNTGYSMGDNLTAMLLGGGGLGSAVLMGGEAAGATTYQSLRSGKTAEQALMDGGISALVESATEKWSLGNLKMLAASSGAITKQSVKTFIKELGKNMAKQGVAEASEEVVSEYANTIYDIIVNGENSEYNQYYVSLLMQGVPADEAEALTQKEFFFDRPGESGLSGGLSGVLFGAGGTFYGNAQSGRIGQLGANTAGSPAVAQAEAAAAVGLTAVEQNAANTLAGIAQRAQTGENTIADTVAEKVLTGEKVGNAELRQLQAAPAPVRRAFTDMTDIDIAGMDSSRMRAAIAAASKNATVTKEKAAQYFSALGQEMQRTEENPAAPVQSATAAQYNTLNYNAPEASAVGAIDAARQGGTPLDVASAPDIGAASDMAADFRRQHTSPATSAQDKWQAIRSRGNTIKAVTPSEVSEIADLYNEATENYDFDLANEIRAELRKNGNADLANALFSGEVDKIITDQGKDSSGQKLSEQQIEFFKDSAVRTKSGRGKLIPMYHGTSEQFTVFNRNRSVHAKLGYGMYFTDNLEIAKEYRDRNGGQNSGIIHKVYLNIKNPCYSNERIDKDRWRKVFDKLGLDASWLQDVHENATNYSAVSRVFGGVERAKVTPDEWTDAMKSAGWDGWIFNEPDFLGDYEYMAVAFDPEQIKLTDNRNPTGSGDIRFSARRNPVSQRDTDYLAAVESGDMDTAQKMVDEAAKAAGYTIKAYHGTARADRVGNEFLPERATSGPMAFFTSDPEIASHYARDKRDTSLAYDEEYDDYYSQFRVNRNGKSIKVQDLWKSMTFAEKQRIKDAGSHITWNEDMDEIVWNDNVSHGLGNWDAYTLNMHNGNAIEALIDCWLESGELYGNEGDFIKVLQLAGIEGVEYRDPDARHEKVYNTFLRIRKPFSTDNVDAAFISAFEKWYSKQDVSAYERESSYADMWDKNSVSAEQFAERLRDDIANKTTHAWTSIPDSITNYLKSLGYDGIQDRGGKYTGNTHTVWVPFSSNQIKSSDPVVYDDNSKVVPLSKRFDDSQNDIRFRLTGNQYNAPALEYALEEGTLNDTQLSNLATQLREHGIDLGENPNTQELLEAVDMLDNVEPGFELTIFDQPAKAKQPPKPPAQRKRAAPEEKQRKAAEAEQKKAAAAERRAKTEKKKATVAAAKAETQAQRSVAAAAKQSIVSSETIKGAGRVNIISVESTIRNLEGDVKAEFARRVESIDELAKAFGHRIRYFTGNMSGVSNEVYGFYHNGTVYANADYIRQAGIKTVAHEICHDIAAHEPGFVNSFYRLYREYCESNGLMNEFNRRWNDIYNNSIYPNKQLAIAEEVLAEKFGEYAEDDSGFFNYCMGKRPSIITRIVEAFNRLLTKLHLKKYSKAAADAMELRNYMLGVMAQHQLRRTGKEANLSAAVRADYRSAQRKAESIGDRYALMDDSGVNLAEWDTTGLASPDEYKNLRKTVPNEITDYGFKKVVVGKQLRNVLIVNPTRYISEGYHADMVAASRSLAASLGIRLGFITGQTSQTDGKAGSRRDTVINSDFLITDDDTLYINLDSEVPYTKIVAGAWWLKFRKSNPVAAANLERLAERSGKLTGDDRIAQDYAVGMLTRTNAQGVKALNLDPETLVEKLSDSKSAAYAFAHERPGIIRKLFENAGDMVAKLTGKQDYRAAYISGQLQARLLKAFSETSPNRLGGNKIETAKRKSVPDGMRFMYAGENAKTADTTALEQAKSMIDSGLSNSIVDPTDEVKFSARRDNNASLREPTRPERRSWLDDYADTYGQIPEGETVNSRGDQRIPRRIDKETKTRQTYRTYAEALTTPDDFVGELEKEVVDGRASYTPLSNKAAAGYADSKIAEGMDEAMATWNAVTHGDVIADKNQIALGERLIMEAINNRDVKLFTKLVAEVAAEATRAGQMVQAISMVKRLSPEGQLMSFQKEVSKLNESLANRKGHPQITPDENLTQEYMDIASELEGVRKEISELEGTPENRRTEREQDAIDSLEAREKQLEQQLRDKKNEMITDAAEQIPPTWMDKLRAWRYLAMLGNPRTHIRNLLGNAVFIPAVRIKQGIAGGIERMTLKEGSRTQGITASKELRDFAREDAKTQLDILAAGGKYNQTDAIAAEQKPFDDSKVIGKTLNKLAEINSAALEGEDAFFLRKHYAFALSRYAAANKWTVEYLNSSPEALAKARGFAYREAQRATYRDLSSFAQLMSKVSNKLSKQRGLGKLGYMMFEGALPFKKTPCNIMKRGIEYSPLGIASAISKGAIMLRDRRNGVESDYSGTEFINDLAAGMTGTMIMGLGYLLTSLGMLHGRDKDEEDEINAIQGVQEYSVIVGDHSYTVDWVTPVAFPLFVGSELYDQISADRDGYSMDDFYNSLSGIAEPLFSLSMMDGIQSMMQSYSSDGAIFEAGMSAAESYVGQYFPTLSGQFARTITPEVHSSSYRDKTDTMPDFASGVVQKAMAKIPGVYSELPEMIDVWGRNVGAGDTWYQRAAENFLSPGYLERIETTDADRLVSDLYRETGDPAVIPGAASKYFTLDGERYDMSPDEYVAYAKTRGKTSYGILSEFYGSEVFKRLTPEQRVSCVETAYKFATAIAKAQTNSGYVIDTKWQREAYDAFLAGETTLAQAIIDYKTK